MPYVDMYVLPVARQDLEAYLVIARDTAPMWLAGGALSVTEAVADDAPMGKITSFPRSVMVTEDETVVVGLITFRDRAHRDEVNAKVMADEKMADAMRNAPVDGKRMIWGGFQVEIQA